MLYRIHQKLLVNSAKGEFIEGGPGQVSDLSMIGADKRAILLQIGVITPVHAPDLGVFPGWELRAERLMDAGIDAIEFVRCTAEEIVELTHNEEVGDWHPTTVEEWQDDVRAYLGIGNIAKPVN